MKKVGVKKKTTTVAGKKKRTKVKDLETPGKNVKGGNPTDQVSRFRRV